MYEFDTLMTKIREGQVVLGDEATQVCPPDPNSRYQPWCFV